MRSSAAVTWLHISDFHFKGGDPYDRDLVLGGLMSSLPALLTRFGPFDLIFATGDIGYSGASAEYQHADDFFCALLDKVGIDRSKLFVVPGNHDADRRLNLGLTRTLASPEQSAQYFGTGQPLVHVKDRFANFAQWYNEFFKDIRSFPLDKTFSLERIKVNDADLDICLLNSAVFSMDDHDSGNLLLGRRSVGEVRKALEASDSDLRVALIHHPTSWLSQVEATNVKTALNDTFDCILTGHLHENEVQDIAGSSGATIYLSAGASYQTTKWPNTALICSKIASEVRVTPIRYVDSPRPMWTLDTALFPNAPTYQEAYPLRASRKQVVVTAPKSGQPVLQQPSSVEAARSQLEDRLLVTPSGNVVYAEPRLMPRTQMAALDCLNDDAVTLKKIAADSASYLIEARPEYGGSTLCQAAHLAIISHGGLSIVRNCRSLPNYLKKLEQDFGESVTTSKRPYTIILDDFDLERDERLLSEVERSGWFSRVILVSPNRRLIDGQMVDVERLPFRPTLLHLWAMGREQIRQFAGLVLDSCDPVSESRAVDKVYSDLLGLRIPLTPSNVLMYLRVLQREGDFEPLSRVDILSRYLAESLRRPSDVSADSFNFKNKMDVLSSFAWHLQRTECSDFNQRDWLNFCQAYQDKTLREFDSLTLYNELLESRIFGSYRDGAYFKYEFYYTFFLGRYLWPRPKELQEFLRSENHLMHSSVIDVVTGLSSENSEIISTLTDRLRKHLQEFSEKYVRADFDPLVDAEWANDSDEEEKLWLPVQKAIQSGPADTKKIDELKTSMIAEARTSYQQVTFRRFNELENALFDECWMLADALKNADDVDGGLKTAAWKEICKAVLIVVQVGTMFAPELAKRKRFRWGGISFVDFDRAAEGLEAGSHEVIVSVITSLVDAAIAKTSQDYGSSKLSSVFKSLSNDPETKGFLNVLNFTCIATARGRGWSDALSEIIGKTDKNAYYLGEMLQQLMRLLRYEVMPSRDRESIKRLVALIQSKRDYNKQAPGSKAVASLLRLMEKDNFFPKPATGDQE